MFWLLTLLVIATALAGTIAGAHGFIFGSLSPLVSVYLLYVAGGVLWHTTHLFIGAFKANQEP
jgi:hypothetical protein